MKIEKGNPGYIKAQKRKYLIWTLAEFAIVIAVFVFGYIQTGTKKNLFTVVAAVGCLPAAKMMVEFIVTYPHKGIDEEKYYEITEKAPLILCLYDMLISSPQKLMPVDVMAISGHVLCGYTSCLKTDEVFLSKYIKKVLEDNHYDKMTVKMFHDYKMFLARVEGMNSIASVEQPENNRREQKIRDILFTLCM